MRGVILARSSDGAAIGVWSYSDLPRVGESIELPESLATELGVLRLAEVTGITHQASGAAPRVAVRLLSVRRQGG